MVPRYLAIAFENMFASHSILNRLTLLLADTNSAASPAGSLGVLTSDSQTPVVSKTTMCPNLLQPLQVLTELALHSVRQYLGVFAIDNIALSVEEPSWNFVLGGILDDGDDSFKFFGCDFTSPVLI